MYLLSIIIPIYNLENYISQCLESILCQMADYKAIEIILINDGSEDNSGNIVDNYANLYPFIKVIHQVNQGVSVARNNGLLQAQGEYIWFIDGDDYLQLNSDIHLLCCKLIESKLDVLFIPVIRSNELKSPTKIINVSDNNDFINLIPFFVEKRLLTYYCYDKLVKKELLLHNQIFFPRGILISEDFYWNIQLFKSINSFSIEENIQYIYRIKREGAVTYNLTSRKINSILEILNQSITEINNINDNVLRRSLLIYTVPVWFYILPEMMLKRSELPKESIARTQAIYLTYYNSKIDLTKYHRGARFLNRFIEIMGISLGIQFYSYIVNIKRTSLVEKFIKILA